MTNIKELENYFNIILEGGEAFPSEHYLLEEKPRHEFYVGVREKIATAANCLVQILSVIEKENTNYFSVLSKYNEVIHKVISLDDEALDLQLRQIAVEELVHVKKSPLLAALAALVGENAALPLMALQDLMKLSEESDEELRKRSYYAITAMKEADTSLFEAKNGIIAKDKKMLEVLRQFKMDDGKGIAQMAVEKFNIKPRPKSHASQVKKEKITPRKKD